MPTREQLHGSRRQRFVCQLQTFMRGGGGDGGHPEQEREPRRGITTQPQEERNRERCPRARYAGDERHRLRAANRERFPPAKILRVARAPGHLLGPQQQQAANGQRDADHRRCPHLVFDAPEEQPDDHHRDRADDDERRQTGRRVLRTREDARHGEYHRYEVLPEIGNDGEERAEVARDVEAEPELIRVPAEKRFREDQVRGARHGQELREPLDDAEQNGFEIDHAVPVRMSCSRPIGGRPGAGTMPVRRRGRFVRACAAAPMRQLSTTRRP